jgi:hypothetical protein
VGSVTKIIGVSGVPKVVISKQVLFRAMPVTQLKAGRTGFPGLNGAGASGEHMPAVVQRIEPTR